MLAWASLCTTALLLVGYARLALQLTVQGLMLSALLVFASAVSTRPQAMVERLMPKKVMLAYYALILSSLPNEFFIPHICSLLLSLLNTYGPMVRWTPLPPAGPASRAAEPSAASGACQPPLDSRQSVVSASPKDAPPR